MRMNSIIRSEINKKMCEALGCFAKATTEVSVPVINLGMIKLTVCNDCKPKFLDAEYILFKKTDHHNDSSNNYVLS